MANLKNINFMSQSKFDEVETYDDEIYAVDYKQQREIPDYTAGTKITATGNYTAPSDGVLIASTASPNLDGSREDLIITIDNIKFLLSPGTSGEDNRHLSQAYLPLTKGKGYSVSALYNTNLYFFPFIV
jgi:hypothetical protein